MSDLHEELTALLYRAEAMGGKVVSIEAIRQVIFGPPHRIIVGRGRWLLRHPDDCPTDCPVMPAARQTIRVDHFADGEYEAWVDPGGRLSTRRAET